MLVGARERARKEAVGHRDRGEGQGRFPERLDWKDGSACRSFDQWGVAISRLLGVPSSSGVWGNRCGFGSFGAWPVGDCDPPAACPIGGENVWLRRTCSDLEIRRKRTKFVGQERQGAAGSPRGVGSEPATFAATWRRGRLATSRVTAFRQRSGVRRDVGRSPVKA